MLIVLIKSLFEKTMYQYAMFTPISLIYNMLVAITLHL